MSRYDFLIVGAGLYGATFARLATDAGYKCLVIDRRAHIAGNCYTVNVQGINVHKFGAHIFHTDNREVWDFATRFADFNNYKHSVIANYKGEIYSLPFNMYTFNEMWGVISPEQARKKIEEQIADGFTEDPQNLEEQAISLIGRDIYIKLVKGYTEKQWGRDATELPGFIIKRLPVRMTFDNSYFNDKYQGIPVNGYTKWISNMLEGIEVKLETDFIENREECEGLADTIIYSGMIDEYYNYELGKLEYRSLRFDSEYLPNIDNFQGNAVVNYTDRKKPFTRIIEHKHFEFSEEKGTIITYEYPAEWKPGDEPYYPINNDQNNELFAKYQQKAQDEGGIFFGGRLGKYKYFDMDDTIADATEDFRKITGK